MTTYGPYVVIVPALDDSDLVYTEEETRQIFRFFYPGWSIDIIKAQIDDTGRAIAQTMVIAAVEGTYQMSYIKATIDVLFGQARKPSREILSLIKKLGKKFAKNWWHHVKKAIWMILKSTMQYRSMLPIVLINLPLITFQVHVRYLATFGKRVFVDIFLDE